MGEGVVMKEAEEADQDRLHRPARGAVEIFPAGILDTAVRTLAAAVVVPAVAHTLRGSVLEALELEFPGRIKGGRGKLRVLQRIHSFSLLWHLHALTPLVASSRRTGAAVVEAHCSAE